MSGDGIQMEYIVKFGGEVIAGTECDQGCMHYGPSKQEPRRIKINPDDSVLPSLDELLNWASDSDTNRINLLADKGEEIFIDLLDGVVENIDSQEGKFDFGVRWSSKNKTRFSYNNGKIFHDNTLLRRSTKNKTLFGKATSLDLIYLCSPGAKLSDAGDDKKIWNSYISQQDAENKEQIEKSMAALLPNRKDFKKLLKNNLFAARVFLACGDEEPRTINRIDDNMYDDGYSCMCEEIDKKEVRQALKTLCGLGYVELVPGKGYQISQESERKQIKDMLEKLAPHLSGLERVVGLNLLPAQTLLACAASKEQLKIHHQTHRQHMPDGAFGGVS